MQDIGERIRYYRTLRGMTYRELAEKCNVSLSLICEVEHGRSSLSVDTLRRVAAALGVSAATLLGEAVESESELMNGLDADEQAEVIRFAEFLRAKKLSKRGRVVSKPV